MEYFSVSDDKNISEFSYFRIFRYAVTSTSSGVIYFGGYIRYNQTNDRVVEFKNLKWTLLGYLAKPRVEHRSIKMENKIYIFGGRETT